MPYISPGKPFGLDASFLKPNMRPSFHAELPVGIGIGATHVGIIKHQELMARLPLRSFALPQSGTTFKVTMHGNVAVKTVTFQKSAMMGYYKDCALRAQVEKVLEPGQESIKDAGKLIGRDITEAFLRANIDLHNYRRLCSALPIENLVEQSTFVTWEKGLFGVTLKEVLIQGRVRGVSLAKMIDPSSTFDGTMDLYPEYAKFRTTLGMQMRTFLGSNDIDFFPANYIFTFDGKLVYIDYQPVLIQEACDANRYFMERMVKSWGF